MAPLTKSASGRARKLTRDQDFQVSSLSASVLRGSCLNSAHKMLVRF
jgi:hypothetical protein